MKHTSLKDWTEINQNRLISFGYRLNYRKYEQGHESLDLDSDNFIGTITCWINGECEMQFNSAKSGDVMFIVTGVDLLSDILIKSMEERGLI